MEMEYGHAVPCVADINKDIEKDQVATGQVSPIKSKHTLVLENAPESQDSLLVTARLDHPVRPPPTAMVIPYAQDVRCASLYRVAADAWATA